MYISILVAYNSTPEDFYKNLCPAMENLGHNVYTHSIQAPFISKIGWLFHSHEHMDLCCLTEFLETLVHRLNPDGPPSPLDSSSRTSGMATKPPRLPPFLLQPPMPAPLHNPGAKLYGPSTSRLLKSTRAWLSPFFTKPCAPRPSGAQLT